MRSDLEPRLRGLYRQPAEGQAEHQRAHEDELVAALARHRGHAGAPRRARGGSGGGGFGWFRLPRFALAGVLGVAVAVGACAMPAEYPVSLGYGFDVVLPPERWAAIEPEALVEHIKDRPGVERVELRMFETRQERIEDGGPRRVQEEKRLQLFVFGDALGSDALATELPARFPALAGLQLRDVPLAGTVHGTLGGKLSHHFLDVVIDRHGVEEAERQLLAGLVAEGVAPQDAQVDITEHEDEDGERRIEVRVEAHRPDRAP